VTTRLRLMVGSLVLVLPGTSMAQGVGPSLTPVMPPTVAVPTPTLPDNPISPTDLPPLNPGAAESGEGVAAPAPAPSGYSGGDYIISDGDPRLWGGVRRRKAVPAYHVVKQGNTLWDICDEYYGDPWSWPQLWAYNKSITNPHWIYPGDQIRLLGAPTGPTRNSLDAGTEQIRLTQNTSQVGGPVTFKQNAFVDPKELADAAVVKGANVEKLLLSQRDEIYIDHDGDFKPQTGKSYAAYRVRRKLQSHEGADLGYLVEVMGTVQVKRAQDDKVGTAIITESVLPIERGNKIGPLRTRFRRMPVARGNRNVDGYVVAALPDRVMHATDDVVFVDIGKSDGIQEGNRLLVVRSGDARTRLLQMKYDGGPRWPREAVAEISVLDVRDNISVGVITRALKEVRVGDRVTLRKGY